MPIESVLTSLPDAATASMPTCSAPPLPQGPCPVCPRLAQEFEPWRQAAYWQAMHQRAVEREAALKDEIARLQAQLRLREQQLFGRTADSTTTIEGVAPRATAARTAAGATRTPTPRL